MNLQPNWASPPGATISRLMAVKEIPGEELADSLDLSRDQFDELLSGHVRINEKLAAAISEQLGATPRLWMARDKAYLRDLARIGQADIIDMKAWLKSMPTASMKKFGWISPSNKGQELADEVLRFFGCRDLAHWGERYSEGIGAVTFRTSISFESDSMATLAWLRAGELQANAMELPVFCPREFADRLRTLKKLSVFRHPRIYFARLREACRASGVALTSSRLPEGCRASGASWVSEYGHPVIHLSFRHLSEDHFWFTFYHEAAHVLLHGNSHIDGDSPAIGSTEYANQEAEANDFAQQALVPAEQLQELIHGRATPKRIMTVARHASVTPGIVVGQLEKASAIPHGRMAFLKHRYRWGVDNLIPDLI